jgi:hypothetical protein
VEYSHHSLPFSEWKAEGPSHEWNRQTLTYLELKKFQINVLS